MIEAESTTVMIDGEVVTPDRAHVSVFDRGFLYGDSVYEVMRAYDGRIFALAEHVDRLLRSARLVHIDMPVDGQTLQHELQVALDASKHRDALVRVHVTRGIAPLGLDPTPARGALRVVIVAKVNPPPDEDYRYGIGVTLHRTERTADNTEAAGAKVANYLVSLLALRSARAAGAKEAIIVDGHGRVLEGASSNVFTIKDGVVLTPPEAEGILPGITRSYVLRSAEALSMPLRITTLTRGDLMHADEVFITSTLREVLPVVRVDGREVGNGKPGVHTRALHMRFRAFTGTTTPPPWHESAS